MFVTTKISISQQGNYIAQFRFYAAVKIEISNETALYITGVRLLKGTILHFKLTNRGIEK